MRRALHPPGGGCWLLFGGRVCHPSRTPSRTGVQPVTVNTNSSAPKLDPTRQIARSNAATVVGPFRVAKAPSS
jgi:hypothetical protein